jgi:DNA primase
MPACRKVAYLAYLLEVAPYIVPYLANRPLTLLVHPAGIEGPRSVEMHWKITPPPFLAMARIYSTNQKHDPS